MVERRHMDYVVRRVDQMEGSQITRGRERPRKTVKTVNTTILSMIKKKKNIIIRKKGDELHLEPGGKIGNSS